MGMWVIIFIVVAVIAYVFINSRTSANESAARVDNKPNISNSVSEDEQLRNLSDLIHSNAYSGDAEYQNTLGMMYLTGTGPYGHGEFTQDIEQAKIWFEKSAAQGYALAQNNLGYLYYQKSDFANALKYYSMAAAQDLVESLISLAMMYGSGEGTTKNKEKAHELFFRAANSDDPFAQYIVGRDFFLGDGVEQNFAEAFKWYWKAAQQGEDHAQFEIASGYEMQGEIDKAKQWYTKSAEQGNKQAQEKLSEL